MIRQRHLLPLGAVLAIFPLFSCQKAETPATAAAAPRTSASAPAQAAPSPQGSQPPVLGTSPVVAPNAVETAWSLAYSARCEGETPEKCPGYHGFSIRNDGTYVIGPGPQGQTLSGWLAPDDRSELSKILSRLGPESSPGTGPRKCEHVEKGLRDTLEASASSWPKKREILGASDDSLCFDTGTLGSGTQASELRETIRSLVRKYSPDTFPNPCVDAVQSLSTAFDDARACSTDTDCAYVDEDFGILDREAPADVVVDDCTFAKPIAVANLFSLLTAQRDLIEKREHVRSTCGAQLPRTNCQQKIAFRTNTAPLCLNKRCTVSGSVWAQ